MTNFYQQINALVKNSKNHKDDLGNLFFTELPNLIEFSGKLNLLDIGASVISEAPVYKEFLTKDMAHLYAFDGDERQIEKIIETYGNNVSVIDAFISDGSVKTLYLAEAMSGMTSLKKPNLTALKFFNNFENFGKILKEELVQTKKLDDVDQIPSIDFLKMDIQGSELDVMKNGMEKLKDCLAIQIEVSYIPLYESQPTFGEIDVYMRSNGYVPHCFLDIKKWSISPTIKNNNFRIPFNQLLESDIVYIKNPMDINHITDEQIKKLILISHFFFKSYDLAVFLLLELINRGRIPTNAQIKYLKMIS
jgi:FkbM family methyltransferase